VVQIPVKQLDFSVFLVSHFTKIFPQEIIQKGFLVKVFLDYKSINLGFFIVKNKAGLR
jgi:hypothetical protein